MADRSPLEIASLPNVDRSFAFLALVDRCPDLLHAPHAGVFVQARTLEVNEVGFALNTNH